MIAAMAAIWFVALDFTEKVKIDETIDQPSSNHKSGFMKPTPKLSFCRHREMLFIPLTAAYPSLAAPKCTPRNEHLMAWYMTREEARQ